tara:strand:+ start:291 stop:410 length:120 start_codon:yes stop_codon:yes gene_type:complete
MRCNICEKSAIVWTYDGKWRCVHCTPKEFKWNKEKGRYE